MLLREILFWTFSSALLICALLVIVSPSAVGSAMFLILAFFFTAGLYVLLDAFFLAVIQILVYAGAVMVLYLFVVMLLDPKQPRRWWFKNFAIVGAPLLGVGLLAALLGVLRLPAWRAATQTHAVTVADVVRPLFTTYLLPLEVTAFILLVAGVGVVTLGRKDPP